MATDIVSQIRPQGAYSSIVLMLVRAVKGDKVEGWKLNRATQNTNGVCVEVCYKKPREAETCLDGAFWNAIQSYLPTARIEHVFTAPDFFLELGGLTLSCLRVTGTVRRTGFRR